MGSDTDIYSAKNLQTRKLAKWPERTKAFVKDKDKDKGICHSTKWEINFYTEPRCAPSSVKFCKQSVNILWRKAVKTNTWGANVRENAEKRGRVQTAKTSQKGHLLDGQCQKFARFTHNGGYLCLKCCFGARSSCCFYIVLVVILLLVDFFELYNSSSVHSVHGRWWGETD